MDQERVCIQGLGFVGAAMATAVSIAVAESGKRRYEVVGVDLASVEGERRVEAINSGLFPFQTGDEKLVKALGESHKIGNLWATTDPAVYSTAGIIIVDIQLDISYEDNEPIVHFEPFIGAIRTIAERVKKGALIVVETTVPPGTCENVVVPVFVEELKKRGLSGDSVFIAHSFERVMPGTEYLESLINYWRVFSGYNRVSADRCEEFLSKVVNVDDFPLMRLSSLTASEAVKVAENSYRAMNIAFIDEWTKFSEALGVDLYEIVGAIRKRPTHVNIRVPGLGVGGYCLTKDPLFPIVTAKQFLDRNDLEFPFARLTVETNKLMPDHALQRLVSMFRGDIQRKRILLCGVGYRRDVGDTRFSPSEVIVRRLRQEGAFVFCQDPYVRYWNELDEEVAEKLPEPIDFDAIVFAVPHSEYVGLNLEKWLNGSTPLILDTINVLGEENRKRMRELDVTVESIGRGDGL